MSRHEFWEARRGGDGRGRGVEWGWGEGGGAGVMDGGVGMISYKHLQNYRVSGKTKQKLFQHESEARGTKGNHERRSLLFFLSPTTFFLRLRLLLLRPPLSLHCFDSAELHNIYTRNLLLFIMYPCAYARTRMITYAC